MNNGPLLFFGVLAALASSFWGLLLAPQLQIGREHPRVIEATGEFYPNARPGLARQGEEIYRAQGCAECHTRQVRQTGVEFELWLTEPGTNKPALISMLSQFKSNLVSEDVAKQVEQLPAKVLQGLGPSVAQGFPKQLGKLGAKGEAILVTLGPDIARLWGKRANTMEDYLHDDPVQLGNLRLGPDLANYGARQTNASLVLLHLYDPRKTMPGSMMPPYRYLFSKWKLGSNEQKPEGAIVLSPATENRPGEMLVPKPEAVALAAYLISLKSEASLTNAPASMPPPAK